MTNPNNSIIIIDEDLNMRSLLSDILTAGGRNIVALSNGDEALKWIVKESGQRTAKVIVYDMNSPKLNGFDFLEKIRKIKPIIPVILTTSFGTPKIAAEAMSRGAFAYISKPFRLDEIEKAIQKALVTVSE